jgi:AraC-like DNA-binding protein
LAHGSVRPYSASGGVGEGVDLLQRALADIGVTPSGSDERRGFVRDVGRTDGGEHRRGLVVVSCVRRRGPGPAGSHRERRLPGGGRCPPERAGRLRAARGAWSRAGEPLRLPQRGPRPWRRRFGGSTVGRGSTEPAREAGRAALAGRLGDAPTLSPEVVWVWGMLRFKPSAQVAVLAAEVGWSRTRLASRFSEQVGISPKRFARVIRFEEARRLVAEGSSSLAEIATRAGYYDQAHLCRDVSALAGCTPAKLTGELGSGGLPDP